MKGQLIKKKNKRREKESSEASEILANIIKESHNHKKSLVEKRKSDFNDLISNIESKYCEETRGNGKRKHQRNHFEDIDDEEFHNLQSKLFKNKKSRK